MGLSQHQPPVRTERDLKLLCRKHWLPHALTRAAQQTHAQERHPCAHAGAPLTLSSPPLAQPCATSQRAQQRSAVSSQAGCAPARTFTCLHALRLLGWDGAAPASQAASTQAKAKLTCRPPAGATQRGCQDAEQAAEQHQHRWAAHGRQAMVDRCLPGDMRRQRVDTRRARRSRVEGRKGLLAGKSATNRAHACRRAGRGARQLGVRRRAVHTTARQGQAAHRHLWCQ